MKGLGLKFITYIACVIVIVHILPLEINAANSQPKPDDSPYYTKYNFVRSDSYMNIGFQPLYLPSGLIATVMSRDLVLKRKLGQMGITIVFYQFLRGADNNKFFLSGDLQGGIVGDMPAITAAAKKDVIIPAITQLSFTSIIAKRYEMIEELRGRRIGYVPGSAAHYTLLKTLSNAGITEKDVTLVPLDTTQMEDALRNKKIFAFSAWEPTSSLTLMSYPESVAVHRTLTFGYVSFSKEFYSNHPEAVREIIAAEIRAIKWIKRGRDNLFLAATWTRTAIRSLVGDNFKITPEQIADISAKDMAWQTEFPVIPENNLKKDGQIALIVEFLKSHGKIDSNVSADKILGSFDRQIVYEVINMSDKYGLDEFNYDERAVK